ncbi:FeS cluster insertion [mine drainage metagenome]|uniref:FeS cluster insertion n=2 Tax=mine drainage metagenome TaxID=410659 RepID=T1C7L6_9ZZZZ
MKNVASLPITLSAAARARCAEFLAHQPDARAVRFSVKRSGCSGYSYVVDLADELGADDLLAEYEGVPVAVAEASLPMLQGVQVDFRREGLNAAFVFENPNATGACGCGESFTVG